MADKKKKTPAKKKKAAAKKMPMPPRPARYSRNFTRNASGVGVPSAPIFLPVQSHRPYDHFLPNVYALNGGPVMGVPATRFDQMAAGVMDRFRTMPGFGNSNDKPPGGGGPPPPPGGGGGGHPVYGDDFERLQSALDMPTPPQGVPQTPTQDVDMDPVLTTALQEEYDRRQQLQRDYDARTQEMQQMNDMLNFERSARAGAHDDLAERQRELEQASKRLQDAEQMVRRYEEELRTANSWRQNAETQGRDLQMQLYRSNTDREAAMQLMRQQQEMQRALNQTVIGQPRGESVMPGRDMMRVNYPDRISYPASTMGSMGGSVNQQLLPAAMAPAMLPGVGAAPLALPAPAVTGSYAPTQVVNPAASYAPTTLVNPTTQVVNPATQVVNPATSVQTPATGMGSYGTTYMPPTQVVNPVTGESYASLNPPFLPEIDPDLQDDAVSSYVPKRRRGGY